MNSLNPGGVETEGTHSAGIVGGEFDGAGGKKRPLTVAPAR